MLDSKSNGLVGVLARRSHVMAELVDGATTRASLRERLDESRSTVYRGLDQLVDHGLVREGDEGYRPTVYGRALFEEYCTFERRAAGLADAREVLNRLPTDGLVPAEVTAGADVAVSRKPAPLDPIAHVHDAVERATSFVGLTPVVFPRSIRFFQSQFCSGDLAAEFVVEPGVAAHLEAGWLGSDCLALTGGPVTIFETTADLPFGLLVTEEPVEETCVVVFGENGDLAGVIRNDAEAAVAWARRTYESFRDGATGTRFG